MKMAKATEQDIDAAGRAMALLDNLSRGYYPARAGEENAPPHIDEDDQQHLRRVYDELKATLDASPGWPCRVIGGMCYVILFPQNRIVDPGADTLELHPRFATPLVEAAPDLLEHLTGTASMLRAACLVISDAEARKMALEQVAGAEAVIAQARRSAA